MMITYTLKNFFDPLDKCLDDAPRFLPCPILSPRHQPVLNHEREPSGSHQGESKDQVWW